MPSLRDRLANFMYGDKVRRAESISNAFVEAYRRLPYSSSPEQLIEQLKEIDSQHLDLLIRQIRNAETPLDTSESVRLSVINESRSLYIWDVITGNIIDLWTDYGFGTVIDITLKDVQAVEVWDEFWKARRNSQILGDREVFKLSTDLLTDGEFFFAYFISKVDGETTLRLIPTEQIREIITDPEDNYTVLYYKREYTGANSMSTLYYKDWQASEEELARAVLPQGAIKAESIKGELVTGTDVVMMQVAHRERSGRGWPLMTAGASWSRAYRNFLQDRAAVSRAVAMYVDKLNVKGSSRTVDMIKARLESSLVTGTGGYDTNPAPTAGSSWIQNEAINRERMPLTTGAGDAEKDGAPLLAQAGLAGRIFPHYLGRGEAFRLATATAMEGPIQKAFNRYKLFWSSVWRDMADIVLTAKETYGGARFETHDATANTDAILQLAIADISSLAVSLKEFSTLGLIDAKEGSMIARKLLQTGMQAVGIPDAGELLPADIEVQAELGEARGIMGYREGLKNAVYGLWSGKIMYAEYVDIMETAIDFHLHQAWGLALKEFGMSMADRTMMEEIALSSAILQEYGYIDGFGEYILDNSKAGGFLLRDLMPRMQLWTNRYTDIFNRALAMVGGDRLMEWVLGPTEEHCETCGSLAGKVKRASQWQDYYDETGIRPQAPALACKGFKCLCGYAVTDKKPTRGKLPAFK